MYGLPGMSGPVSGRGYQGRVRGHPSPDSAAFFLTETFFFNIISYTKDLAMPQYEECIIFLLAKAYQKAYGNFKRHLLPRGLTPVQHLILESLWEEEGLSAGDIGKRLVLDSATLSGVLDRMAEKGWIRKEPDDEDKRFIRIYLTEKARELKPLLIQKRELANEEILRDLSLEERVLLKRLLRDVRG